MPEPPAELAYVIVNEAGASDYSTSPIAREEFPNLDATVRGTISIGRRLQDPLSELVKIDPQHVGVGLYQHDVKSKHLKESLEAVIESCVNYVGVDLNTASVPLLRHVAGLNQAVARELIEYRKTHGSFKSREQLLQVPGLGPARFTQAAGFLKIHESETPFDRTWIHPESYAVAEKLLAELGFVPADLNDKTKLEQLREKLSTLNLGELSAKLGAGLPTLQDIVESLARPGRDPREDLPPPIFKKGILKLEDLQPGMELKGTVLNVVDFGAFVDIGLKDSGLVHISQMANRFIRSPYDVVAVGDVVTVWVLTVHPDRRRVSLTMIPPGTERKPPEREQRRPGPGPREMGDRSPRFQDRGGPRPQASGESASVGAAAGGPPPRGGYADRGPRPPRPAGGGFDRPRQGPPPQGGGFRGGPPPRGPRRPEAPPVPPPAAPSGEAAPAAATPPPPPPPRPMPPRKPAKPKPLPTLSQAALKGKAPLHTFGELEAFFKAKDEAAASPTAAKSDTPATNPTSTNAEATANPSGDSTPTSATTPETPAS